jgi:4-amino-4-deoxy-L-arabinose transferase-like glycosyltransferase
MTEKKYIYIILLLSLIVRFAYIIFSHDNKKYYWWDDTVHYYTAATNLVEDGTFGEDPERPTRPFGLEPIYPVFLAGIISIFGKSFSAVRLIQGAIFTVSGVAIFLILKRLTSNLFALIGMAFYLFYPFYIYASGCLLTEAIYPPLLALLVFLCLEYVYTGKGAYYYLSAIVLGVAFHTRVSSISLIVPLLALPYFQARKPGAKYGKENFIAVMAILLVSVPWGIRNYRTYGRITIPRNFGVADVSITSLLGQYTGREGSVEDVGIAKSSLDKISALLSPFITAEESTEYSSSKAEFSSGGIFQIISFISVFPLLLSTVILPAFRRDKSIIVLYGFLVFYLLPYVILTARTRFRLPIDFVMIIFLTVLLAYLSESISRLKRSKDLTQLQTA